MSSMKRKKMLRSTKLSYDWENLNYAKIKNASVEIIQMICFDNKEIEMRKLRVVLRPQIKLNYIVIISQEILTAFWDHKKTTYVEI